MTDNSVLDDAKQDLRTSRRERDFSIPAVLAVFLLIELSGSESFPGFAFVLATALIVYALMSIRVAIYAIGLRNVTVMGQRGQE